MKKTRLLTLLLALILGVSVVFSGCRKEADTEAETEEVTLTVEEQKDAVVKALNQDKPLNSSGLGTREWLEQILGTNVFEATLQAAADKSTAVLSYKDGYLYVTDNNRWGESEAETWMYFGNTDVVTFKRSQVTGKWEGQLSSAVQQGDTELRLDILEGFSFPKLKEGDLKTEGGKVVLNNDYIKAALKQPAIYDLLFEDETLTSDMKAATNGILDAIVDAFGLKVSFRFSGTRFSKIHISMDLDASELSTEVKAALPTTMKGSVEIGLNDKANNLTSLKVNLEIVGDDGTFKINAKVKSLMDGDVIKGVDCNISMDIKDTQVVDPEDMGGDLDGDGLKLYDSVIGDESYNIRFRADFSKAKAGRGATVIDAEMSCSTTAKKILTYLGEEVSEKDAGVKLKDFDQKLKVTFVAKASEPGVISFDMEANGNDAASGTMNFNAAPTMPAVPTEIQDFVRKKMK